MKDRGPKAGLPSTGAPSLPLPVLIVPSNGRWTYPWVSVVPAMTMACSYERSGGHNKDSLTVANMQEASTEEGPIVIFGLHGALQASAWGGRGNGMCLVPLWLPPTMNSLKRLCLRKRLLQPSVSVPWFIVTPLCCYFTASTLTKHQVYSLTLCVCPLGCLTNVSASANTLEFE